MRLTVAGETPTSAAICLPVQRWRRSASTCSTTAAGVGRRRRCGREERSCKPANAFGAEARHPFAHRPRADACGSCGGLRRLPAQRPARTIRSRPSGVRRAFLWMFIRSSEESLKLRNLQLPRSGPDGQPIESSQRPVHRFMERRPAPSLCLAAYVPARCFHLAARRAKRVGRLASRSPCATVLGFRNRSAPRSGSTGS